MRNPLIAGGVAVLAAALTWGAAHAEPAPRNTEYLTVRLPPSPVDIDFSGNPKGVKLRKELSVLSSLARDGWTLVSVANDGQPGLLAFLTK
jgi:hypothetical protein